MKILEIKRTRTEMKGSVHVLNSRTEESEGRIGELENRIIKLYNLNNRKKKGWGGGGRREPQKPMKL